MTIYRHVFRYCIYIRTFIQKIIVEYDPCTWLKSLFIADAKACKPFVGRGAYNLYIFHTHEQESREILAVAHEPECNREKSPRSQMQP